jgi:hypothetical protein
MAAYLYLLGPDSKGVTGQTFARPGLRGRRVAWAATTIRAAAVLTFRGCIAGLASHGLRCDLRDLPWRWLTLAAQQPRHRETDWGAKPRLLGRRKRTARLAGGLYRRRRIGARGGPPTAIQQARGSASSSSSSQRPGCKPRRKVPAHSAPGSAD